MDSTKFKYDMPILPVYIINCYPVNMVYDTGSRILNLATDTAAKYEGLTAETLDADTPTIVVQKV